MSLAKRLMLSVALAGALTCTVSPCVSFAAVSAAAQPADAGCVTPACIPAAMGWQGTGTPCPAS
jgi:hypothetical protein